MGGGSVDLGPVKFDVPSLGQAVDASLQITTGGLLGYDSKNGQVTSGVVGKNIRPYDEAVGELSGRNYQRKIANEQRDLAAAQAEAEAQIARERLRAQKIDIAASDTAAAIRASSRAGQSAMMGGSQDTVLLGERDFLGV